MIVLVTGQHESGSSGPASCRDVPVRDLQYHQSLVAPATDLYYATTWMHRHSVASYKLHGSSIHDTTFSLQAMHHRSCSAGEPPPVHCSTMGGLEAAHTAHHVTIQHNPCQQPARMLDGTLLAVLKQAGDQWSESLCHKQLRCIHSRKGATAEQHSVKPDLE